MKALMSAALLSLAWAAEAPRYGVLLLAHGGNQDWNAEIAAVGQKLSAQAPTEVALGMADAVQMQAAVSRLEAKGVGKIVAVPLFINSASEVMDQTRYVLGIAKKPSPVLKEALAGMPGHGQKHHHGFSEQRVATGLPVVLLPALDAHPAVAEILADRARALSRDIRHETVILVGHGPVDDKADKAWLKTMRELAASVRLRGGFKDVKAATLRDDSPAAVKKRAAEALRRLVSDASQGGGRAIVIPYLIARGGIEEHIVAVLKGLDYAWDGKTLCPHPAVMRWASEAAALGANGDNMRVYSK